MNPTIERKAKRIYCVQLGRADGYRPPVIRIHADTLCPESDSYTFKREGNVVGIVNGPIQPWWIEEEPRRSTSISPPILVE